MPTESIASDFEAKAATELQEAATDLLNAEAAIMADDLDSAVSYLRDAIDAIRAAEGWRAAAQALADAAVRT